MEPVTKNELIEILDQKLVEQRLEFQGYIGVVSEEFQSRLQGVSEMVRQNTSDIKEIKTDIVEMKSDIVGLRTDMVESFIDLGEVIRSVGGKQEDHEQRICVLEEA